MKRTVRFLQEALDELLETPRWYASREQDLGQAFAEANGEAVERIAQDPAAFPCVNAAVRRLVVRRFPDLISNKAPRTGARALATADMEGKPSADVAANPLV